MVYVELLEILWRPYGFFEPNCLFFLVLSLLVSIGLLVSVGFCIHNGIVRYLSSLITLILRLCQSILLFV